MSKLNDHIIDLYDKIDSLMNAFTEFQEGE